MGKILLVVLVGCALLFQGCEAFKNSYDSPPESVLASVGLLPAGGTTKDPGASNEKQPGGTDSKQPATSAAKTSAVDYSVDKTICEQNKNVVLKIAEADAVASDANSGWTSDVKDGGKATILAEKKADFTTAIEIAKGAEKLSFTVKQIGDKEYVACDVIYEACLGECLGVKSLWSDITKAEISIQKINKEDNSKVINSGAYSIEFGKSNMGDEGTKLEGSYFSDLIGEAFSL